MHHIRRRQFIAGLGLGAGATILTPWLRGVLARAHGQSGGGAKRFVMFVNSLGVREGHRVTGGGTDFDLGESWAPLAPYRDRLLVVENFYQPFNMHLHGNRWGFACTEGVGPEDADVRPGGATIDRLIAREISQGRALTSLSLTPFVSGNGARRGYASVSADGRDVVYPSDGPVAAFARLFGSGEAGMDEDEAAARIRRDRRVLDFAADDVRRLRARLAGPERERLDQYLASIEELQDQIGRVADTRAACDVPSAPDPAFRTDDDPEDVKMAISVRLAQEALVCGFTNQLTFVSGNETFPFLGEDGEIGRHQMWHGDGTPAKHTKFYAYQAAQMAAIWERLEAVPEGDGTMADDTLMMWINQSGGGHHNGSYDYWVMLLSGRNVDLDAGRRVVLPLSPLTENDVRRTVVNADLKRAPGVGRDAPVHALNDLFVSVANACGLPIDSFGDPRICAGPVPGLQS